LNSGNSCYESTDYTNTNISSSLFTPSPKVQSPISNPIAPKANSFTATSPFKLFNILKPKTKPDQNAINLQQQQQQQKELQQQKLKQQKTDLKTIGQYIKSFEAIVIKSLRQYTLTTSVNLQTRILELLIQLVFLKVDYCLLDSDKVFIDYVLRQFEYLEQKRSSSESSNGSKNNFECDETGSNHLSKSYLVDLYENFDSESSISDPLNIFDIDTMLNKLFTTIHGPQSSSHGAGSASNLRPDKNFGSYSSSLYGSSSPIISSQHLRQEEHQRNHILIPKLFDFLILLSHEKKSTTQLNSKSNSARPGNGLLTIPEIMQLADNLIASENSHHTHAIPALRPLVIDLFLNRANEDTKEIDLQHDVSFNTLLRLIQYPQMWPLLTIAISKFKRDNQEKWKKNSRQVCDALFDSMRSTVSNFR
jgi:hypothetical protein